MGLVGQLLEAATVLVVKSMHVAERVCDPPAQAALQLLHEP